MKPQTIFITVLCVLLLLLQYKLWFSDEGLRQYTRLQDKIAKVTENNIALQAKNMQIAAEVKNLKQGEDAVEESARNDLGLVKTDETFYQILE